MTTPTSPIVDDTLIDRARAKDTPGLVEFLTARKGMPLAKARAELLAELRDAERNKDQQVAKMAACLSGFTGPGDGPFTLARYASLDTRRGDGAYPATASRVLATHARLHDVLASPAGTLTGLVRWFAETHETGSGWLGKYMFAPYHVAGQRSRDGWEAKFLGCLARGLAAADTFQVTAPMCEVAEQMYEHTAEANGQIEAADLPAETGFLWLDKPFRRVDKNGQGYSTRAVSWAPATLRRDSGPEDGVRVTLWFDWAVDPELGTPDRVAKYEADGTLDEVGPLVLVMSVVVPFGADFGGSNAAGVPMPLHYVHAVWMLLGTEVAVSERERADRGTRRRLAGGPVRHDTVTVITLRRAHHATGQEAGHRDVEWSCRWIVRGFYRHHWGYGTIGHPHQGTHGPEGTCGTCGARVTWVRPFIKGPDGVPLKANAGTLYRLSR